jgi:hypothetical protein
MINVILTIVASGMALIAGFVGYQGLQPQENYGTTVTSIAGSDTISSSRTVIHDNFTVELLLILAGPLG